ncbi:MAG: DNA repair protein RadA [Acutalibacteraceae bacterium]
MASKTKVQYVCTECGFESAKWYGKCPSCNAWNTMEEEVRNTTTTAKRIHSAVGSGIIAKPVGLHEIDSTEEQRYHTGLSELDRVLGGGLVKGSLVLISGDPVSANPPFCFNMPIHGNTLKILYVSGEESKQIKLRITFGVATICINGGNGYPGHLEQVRVVADILIVDSIQTMNHTDITSSPGSITQVRECTNAIMHTAKDLEIPALVVGHVNKDGAIAGPKVLEHIVDAVLYFEGDRHNSYRILRAVKNRYGSTNEIGVFDMTETGLQEIENPSIALLSGRPQYTAGTCVTCVMEGSRPILAEIQGLASTTGFGNPRRMSTGFDYNRMSLLLAVLEKRAGYYFSNLDAYINVVGGLRLDEPAVDLAVAMALVSSLKDVPISENCLVFGEIGLAGELRSVSHINARISEAIHLGFQKCIVPYHNLKQITVNSQKIQIIGVRHVREAFEAATDT